MFTPTQNKCPVWGEYGSIGIRPPKKVPLPEADLVQAFTFPPQKIPIIKKQKQKQQQQQNLSGTIIYTPTQRVPIEC